MDFRYELNKNNVGFQNSLESILKNRDIENVREFLNPTEQNIEDENLYDNIDHAANKLITNIKDNNDISIVIDCDADGYTSAAIMYQYIYELIKKFDSKSKLNYVIHDDKKHGLDEETVNNLITLNPKLIVIPDAGSNDYEQHKLFNDKNIEIIILDHHECDKFSDYAIVVNNQLSEKVTNKTITGAGIVYKFCKYIDKLLDIDFAESYLDLVSIGMIADSCDLRNLESRHLTLKGINQISKEVNKNKLISSLIKKKSYDMKNKITILGIAFYIAPLINSIIRNGTRDEKELMFKAFINSDEKYIDKIRGRGEVELSIQDYVVRIAEKCKRKQKKLIDAGLEVLTEQIDKYKLNSNGVIVVNGTGLIDSNYTGLIANKLTSIFQKPCLILKTSKKKLGGSGRGYDKSEIKDFKEWCNNTNLFDFAEGHGNAFGVQIEPNKINDLYELIGKIKLSGESVYYVDGIFTENNLNKYTVESIARHDDIWGTTVVEPLFAISGLNINTNEIELIGSKKTTVKFKFKDIEFIKFKSSEEEFNEMKKQKAVKLTMVGRFGLNTYNGTQTPQVTIESMKYEEGVVKFRF